MLSDKRFDIDMDDSMIVSRVKYKGTYTGLYELIFKRIPDVIYIEDDKQTYKSILLTTNAHRRGHDIFMFIMDNKEHKYKYIIGPLVFAQDLTCSFVSRWWRCHQQTIRATEHANFEKSTGQNGEEDSNASK